MPATHTYDEGYAHTGDDSDEWLTIGEAAALMHQSISTLRRYDASGVLKADRTLGGQRRYLRSAIEAAIRARSEGAA